MKKIKVPDVAYLEPYHMYKDRVPKIRTIRIGDSRMKIHRLFMAANPNHSGWSGMKGNGLEFFHFSLISCKSTEFQETPVICVCVRNGKVAQIKEHIPYVKGRHDDY